MKQLIVLVSLLIGMQLSAQECDMPIAVTIPQHLEGLSDTQRDYLYNKIEQMVVSQGVSADFYSTQFILNATVAGIQKETLSTTPVSVACQGEVILRLLDRNGMKVITSKNLNIRGAGSDETKALQNALKLINPQNKNLTDFVSKAKTKVLAYYDQQVMKIISQSRKLSSLGQYEEAFNLLAAVPECCSEYTKVTSEMVAMYPKALNKIGENYLKQARMIWTANQSREAAEEVCYWLSLIDPRSSAYPAGERLYAEVKGRVKEEIRYDMKKYDDQIDLVKEQIRAVREIGKAYGRAQGTSINIIR